MCGFEILGQVQNYKMTLRECEVIINAKMSLVEKFKIGKTGDTCEERFKNYNGEYEDILPLYESNDKDEINKLEADLIDMFIRNEKCDNEKDGDDSINDQMSDENGNYIVYMVYNKKHE